MPAKNPTEYAREWRARNPERSRATQRKSIENRTEHDKALARERNKRYRENNKERIKANYESRKPQLNERRKERTRKIKDIILEHYGAVCVCCGENIKEFLTIDHKNGGGCKHREEIGFGYVFYKWVVDNGFPEDLQIMCMNCNFAKGSSGRCPHEDMRGHAQH